ncbi:MAG: cryptochrome/photolyase family protein [Campylobacterota bacterium]
MKQILWFRRDLRITDSAILSFSKKDVLPIFIFDTDILKQLPSDDKRVTFIYKNVMELKKRLKTVGLDLAIFYAKPIEIFSKLKGLGFDEVLCSSDFDYYSKSRDKEIEKIIPLRRYCDSFILNPWEVLKKDNTPYKVFTPFYKSLDFIHSSHKIELFKRNESLQLCKECDDIDFDKIPSLEEMGFIKQKLPKFLTKSANSLIDEFIDKMDDYEKYRDYFFIDATSNLSVHLRFGLISPREVFNKLKALSSNCEFFIRELFWREFYNTLLYHFPKSQFENFNGLKIQWNESNEDFKKWCEGKTGVPIIDAAMQHLNNTGCMHNRLRMVVSSFLTKNLLIDWRKGERYFALKLLDYEASSNIGSWQWAASTGADSVPYFRVFNPYTQSEKFDKDGLFIKSVLTQLKDVDSRLLHKENGVFKSLFVDYEEPMISIKDSRQRAIETFKRAKK